MSKPVRRIRSRYLRWRGAPPDADSWRATPHAFERDDPIPEPQARPPQAPLTLTSPPSSTVTFRRKASAVYNRVFEATEMYCPVPNCSCGEVMVDFETLMPRGPPSPGRVTVQRAGAVKFESGKDRGGRLARLWAAFEQRFPKHLERFARRYPVMKEVGARVVAKPRPSGSTKVGRNGPCPAGLERNTRSVADRRRHSAR